MELMTEGLAAIFATPYIAFLWRFLQGVVIVGLIVWLLREKRECCNGGGCCWD